jgi:transketolase
MPMANPSATDKELRTLALKIRRSILQMTHRAKSSHVGTSLSIADIMAVLYGDVLRVNPKEPSWPDRDRFVLSKGHGAAAAYAALAHAGYFSVEWTIQEFYKDGSVLAGHVSRTGVPGVDASTGSLGHGLPIACGMALAGKRDGRAYRVFTVLSDGECDEGSTWEAALFAPHHGLDNLVAIIDYNKIQSFGRVKDVLDLDPLADKWKAFRWSVREVDGHNTNELAQALRNVPFEPGRPSCIVAHTTKGKGVSFMEDKLLWHYRPPDDGDIEKALAELETSE